MPVKPGEKVFLYFHGGGYVLLSAHPQALSSNIPRSLLELTDTVPRALAIEYHLSSTHPLPDCNSFPAALLDASSGYNNLVNVVGYDPCNVIVVGDSASGNLALARGETWPQGAFSVQPFASRVRHGVLDLEAL